MKALSAILAVVGAVCLMLAALLGAVGISEYQSDRERERFPAEVTALRAEGAYVYPVLRYTVHGTDYQVIVKNRDCYQGEKLDLIFRDDTRTSMEIYRESPLQYGKVLAAVILAAFGAVLLAVAFLLLRLAKRMESRRPVSCIPPLLFGVGVTALCVLLAVNVFCYLPQNRDREADYPTVNATLIMVPEKDGDTVAQYKYNGKTYKAKVSRSNDNYVGREIPLYIKYRDPGIAKEKLNDAPFLTAANIAVGAFGAVCVIISIFQLKSYKKATGKKTAL